MERQTPSATERVDETGKKLLGLKAEVEIKAEVSNGGEKEMVRVSCELCAPPLLNETRSTKEKKTFVDGL